MTTTLVFGSIGFIFFVNNYEINIDYYRVSRFGFIIVIVAIFAIFGMKQNRFKIKGFSIERIIEFIKNISSKIHFKTIFFSIIRYLIFSFQFYYLLLMFGVEVDYTKAMMVITSMYLLSSIIPTIFIFDVIIKGSVAVYLFSIVGVNEITILCIVTLMWLLNFVLPSILGSYYVLNFNLYDSQKE